MWNVVFLRVASCDVVVIVRKRVCGEVEDGYAGCVQ